MEKNSRDNGRGIARKSSSPLVDHLMSTPVATIKRPRKDDDRVNPFERHLLNRLHEPIWSPSILSCTNDDVSMETPPQTTWAIDQIAKLNPIGIEESPSTHQNETILDAQSEAKIQATISAFFSKNEPIAPSPIITTCSSGGVNPSNTKSINTDLSFPSILPPEFEQFLYSFNQGKGNGNQTMAGKNLNSTNISSNINNSLGKVNGVNNECLLAENGSGSNSNSSSQGHMNHQHPPTPNPELNTSVTRRKLDFTDMEHELFGSSSNNASDDEGEDDDDGDGANIPITSIILDMENSNGRTINSPTALSSTSRSVLVEDISRIAPPAAAGSSRMIGNSYSSSSCVGGCFSVGRSCGSNCSLMEINSSGFGGSGGSVSVSSSTTTNHNNTTTNTTNNYRFIRSSEEEYYLSSSDTEFPERGEDDDDGCDGGGHGHSRRSGEGLGHTTRLGLLLLSPETTPIRME